MSRGKGILGWPHDFYQNRQYGAACSICRNQSALIAIHRDCRRKHNTCGTCFDKHSWDEEKKIYECPRCVYERMVEVKKKIEKWMEERSFVQAPGVAPGAFMYSAEAAKQKAIREGKNPNDIRKIKSKTAPAAVPAIHAPDSIEAIDEGDVFGRVHATASNTKKGPQKGGSASSTRKIKHRGTEKEYAQVKHPEQVVDCEFCSSALCMDCIWEVVPTSSSK